MSLSKTLSASLRVLKQLRHDPRTLGLVLLMPTVLMVILYFVFKDNHSAFNHVAPLILGIILFTLMFIITSVAMLRERTSGTLERLLTSPISKLDIMLGYALAFATLALVQATIVSVLTLTLLGVDIAGELYALVAVAVIAGVSGMAFGLFFSAFAKNEFQVVQFMPAFVLPQFLTCGLFIPREQMATFLEYFSNIMPLTYIVKALQEVQVASEWTSELTLNVVVMCGFTILALILGAISLKSR